MNKISVERVDEVVAKVEHEGFSVIREFEPALETALVASLFGSVIDIPELLGTGAIAKVQTLTPHTADESSPNRYSGHFGLSAFPLHTDLAHWHRPPRFFVLRCITGSASVPTYLLPRDRFVSDIGESIISRAVCRPRRHTPGTPSCPMPILFVENGNSGIRWDSVFLEPMNACACAIREQLEMAGYVDSIATKVVLNKPGDILIVDNWTVLHGRGGVPIEGQYRRIERAYLQTRSFQS